MKRSERKLIEKEAGVTATTEDEARAYVGCKVAKYSGKPFKSRKRIATVSSWGWIHCNNGKTKFGLKLEEDDTVVPCKMIYVVERCV